MLRRDFLSSLVAGVSTARAALAAPLQGMKNVVDYGAKPDGRTLNTRSIQRAIDDAFQSGGGTVYFPAGNFLTGRIDLKSRVGLYFGDGSALLGSTSIGDYHGAPDSPVARPRLLAARPAQCQHSGRAGHRIHPRQFHHRSSGRRSPRRDAREHLHSGRPAFPR